MLQQGLLWYDDTNKSLARKVLLAAARYMLKHQQSPNVCYLNPAQYAQRGQADQVDGIRLAEAQTVLPHHLWLGIEAA